MDVLIPYQQSSFNELKYALRSICLYQPHDEVILIGDIPEWYSGKHIPATDIHGRPEFSVTSKILKGIECCSEDFILWQDDIYKLNHKEIKPFYCNTLKDALFLRQEGRFRNIMANTVELFPDGYYYGGHTPMVINGKKFQEAVEKCWIKDLIPKTMYGNYANIGGELVEDCKIKGTTSYDFIKEFIQGKDYFSTGHYSVNKDMVRVLDELFPEKCKYEK